MFSKYARILFIFLLGFITYKVSGQLCTGSLGDPVKKITFGAGTNPGDPLSGNITSMTYVSNDCPQDGFYTIRTNTLDCFGNSWHSLNSDHTGDPNGYMMIINANFQPSEFYVQTIDGLCGNTTYEFAAWVLSLDRLPGSIPVNITFTIEKADGSGTILQSYNTKDILPTTSPQWKQYGLFFQTPSNVTSVVLRMRNNGPGGNGNDLALDDITFRPCGPSLTSVIVGSNKSDSTSFCEGSTASVTLHTEASVGYTSPVYQWQISTDNAGSWQDIPGANTTTYSRAPTPKGKYLYRLAVAESGNGGLASCRVVSNNLIVNVAPNPIVKLTTNTPVCESSNLILTGTVIYNSTITNNFAFQYPDANPVFISKVKNDDAQNNISTFNQVIKSSLSSAGKYVLTAQNSYGCSSSASTIVIINPKPVSNYSFDNITCEKNNIHFKDQSTSAYAIASWSWMFGDGGTSTDQKPIYTYSSSGNYVVSQTVTDINGCKSDTLIKNIVVHPLPFPDFILPKVCLKDSYAQFFNASTISDNTSSSFNYIWNFGDNGSTSNTSNFKDPKHVYNAAKNYDVNLTVTSVNGCIKDTTKTFTVNGSVPKSMFNVNNGSVICSKDTVSISNNSVVDFGKIVKVQVYWDYLNNPGIVTIDDSPYLHKNYGFNYDSLMRSKTSNYTIRFVAYSGINCVDEMSQVVTIQKTPTVQFATLNNVCLETSPYNLTAARETSGASGFGIYTGVGVISPDLFNPRKAGVGTHNIRYTFTSDAGCAASLEQPIIIYPQPSVDAGADKTIIKGATITLHPTASGNSLSYLWTPPTYLNNPTDSATTATPLADITYTLMVTSSNNCSNKDSVHIKVLNGLYIPNAFTPNNDGRNDLWKLPYLDEFPNTVVSIYNRYGQVVFHSVGSSVSWDGTYNGIPQIAGVYVYVVDLKNNKPVIKGTVMLIR